jgi:hypothetical protein
MVSVYPNPANQKLNVVFSSTGSATSLELVDITGRVCLFLEVNQTQSIDVSQLPAGTYLLRLVNANGISHQRIIIQH